MTLKKLCAITSLLTIVALLCHMISASIPMILGIRLNSSGFCVDAILVLIAAHAFFGIASVFYGHDGSTFSCYSKLNRRTGIQRTSALLIIILIHFHRVIFRTTVSGQWPAAAVVVGLVVQLLLVAVTLRHVAVSFSRAFITLGFIRTQRAEIALDRVAGIVCALLFLMSIMAFVTFTVPFIAAGL